jgi:hypothetical protein
MKAPECTCIEDMKQAVRQQYGEHIEVDMNESINFTVGRTELTWDVKYKEPDKKRWKHASLVFSYCPFCGRDMR